MKTTLTTLTAALILSFGLAACDRDGNTGNGANDPTDQFESDKVKKNSDFYGKNSDQASDTTAKETTTLTTVDTTMVEGRHK
jgi:predicted small lipoprotein YifL